MTNVANRPTVAATGTSVSVRVPGSAGNVGPGFDTLGLALGHYDDLTVTRVESGLEFDLAGEGADSVPRTSEHLVIRAMQTVFDAAGAGPLPGLRLRARNRIPHGRGMGSSASAAVAGVLAANALLPEDSRLDEHAVLQLCSQLEGHPDNVAPTLYGGLTVSFERDGEFVSVPVSVHTDIVAVVAVPNFEVATSVARALLPDTVAHRTAAVTAGRAALLVEALSRRPEYLLPATFDLLHQPYRAQSMAPSFELMTRLRERGFAALISGAGPTVLTLAHGEAAADEAEVAITDITSDSRSASLSQHGSGVSWRVLKLRVPAEGAKVEVSTQ